jgi:hypothetical protein
MDGPAKGQVEIGALRRPDYLSALISPRPRFLWGLILMPSLFLVEDWKLGLGQLCLCAFLCVAASKRIRPLSKIVFIFTMTLFSALRPQGRILWQAYGICLTQGSVERGLLRSLPLVNLIFVSAFSVSPGLVLPGSLGGLLAQSLRDFNALMEGGASMLRRKQGRGSPARWWFGLLDSLDCLLLRRLPIEGEGAGQAGPISADRIHEHHGPLAVLGWIAMALSALCCYALALWPPVLRFFRP